MTTRYTTSSGKSITLGKKLGTGGEGAVYDVSGAPHLVAKIYHAHRLNAALANKVRAMVADPPEDATRKAPLNHVSIAWPTDIVMNGGAFVGYLMPKLPKSDDLYDLLQPQQRKKQHGHLNHRHLYRTARNLALAVEAIHQKKYVIGDINFKNALFNDDAMITIVDCDSMQVTEANGTVHRCIVGMPEYTSPELQSKDFNKVVRTENHDAFGLAVLIFQLLMQGFHPFTGRAKPGIPDVEQSHVYCIQQQIFPYLDNQPYEPPRVAPSFHVLPSMLQQLFTRAFTQTNNRPTPKEWAHVISLVEKRLVQCRNDVNHYYPSDGACVICEIDFNSGRRQRTSPPPRATSSIKVPMNQPASNVTMPNPAPVLTHTATNTNTGKVTTNNPNQTISTSTQYTKSMIWMISIFIVIVIITQSIYSFGAGNLWSTMFGTRSNSINTAVEDTSCAGCDADAFIPTVTKTRNKVPTAVVEGKTITQTKSVIQPTRRSGVVAPTTVSVPQPILQIRKNDGRDTSSCISMQISGIDTLYWRLVARGSPLEPAVFDSGGNARLCDPADGPAWIGIQDGFYIDILNPNFDPVPGGVAPAIGGDIFVAVWLP